MHFYIHLFYLFQFPKHITVSDDTLVEVQLNFFCHIYIQKLII